MLGLSSVPLTPNSDGLSGFVYAVDTITPHNDTAVGTNRGRFSLGVHGKQSLTNTQRTSFR